MIDWSAFAPLPALAGGVVLGVAVATLLFFNGKIAGVSGIAAGLLNIQQVRTAGWRIAFLAGLIAAPLAYQLIGQKPLISLSDSSVTLAAAGLLTGIGTGLASGCTSGHGVCGIARLSPRSLFATLCFMATGIVTVYIARHVWN
jgi:uncharacterized membrane protein YedE/YeeE